MKVFDLHQDILYHIIENPKNSKILKSYKNIGIEKFLLLYFHLEDFMNFMMLKNP